MKKLFRITTVAESLSILLKGQLGFLNDYYEVVGIASGKENLKVVEEREGIRVIDVPMRREIAMVADVVSLFRLIRLFYRERPYIVHANTPKASLLSMIAAWITRVPHRIYTVTGLRFETATGKFRRLLVGMEKITCWCATKVIPEGEGVKKTLMANRITRKPLKVILNGNINGIDIDYFNREAVLADEVEKLRVSGCYTFVFVGRLVRDKGIRELVRAFSKLYRQCKHIRLFVVGGLEQKLDSLDEETLTLLQKHEAIYAVGFQQDIRPYLAASDALVFPSYREGFPNVVLQAGAMGLPAIVTDISGCNEIIQNGVNGIIIPSRDENILYEAMEWFYEHQHEEIKEMAKHARPIISERYESHKVWEALLKEYQSL